MIRNLQKDCSRSNASVLEGSNLPQPEKWKSEMQNTHSLKVNNVLRAYDLLSKCDHTEGLNLTFVAVVVKLFKSLPLPGSVAA